jgi:membrane protein
VAFGLVEWDVVLCSLGQRLRRDRLAVAAGAFAFRWFLSLFPALIALLGVASATGVPALVVERLVKGIGKALPAGASQVLEQAVVHASTAHAGVVAALVAGAVGLWSALSGIVMVEEALDMAYELPTDRSFLRKRIVAVPLLFASVVLGGVASALVVFGQPLGAYVAHHVGIGGASFSIGWTALRWVVALAFVTVLLGILYHLAPNRPQRRVRLWSAGSLLATALWAAISLGFSYYTSSFGSYAKTYGALAGVAILIVWLYLTGVAIFLGAELDAVLEQRRAQHPPQDMRRAQGGAEACLPPAPGPSGSL